MKEAATLDPSARMHDQEAHASALTIVHALPLSVPCQLLSVRRVNACLAVLVGAVILHVLLLHTHGLLGHCVSTSNPPTCRGRARLSSNYLLYVVSDRLCLTHPSSPIRCLLPADDDLLAAPPSGADVVLLRAHGRGLGDHHGHRAASGARAHPPIPAPCRRRACRQAPAAAGGSQVHTCSEAPITMSDEEGPGVIRQTPKRPGD